MMRGIEQYLQVDAATLGALKYQGVWNASTNTPTLTSGVGVQGQYYVVSVAGTTNLDGETNWGVGDWAVFNGTVWQKVDGGSTGNLTTLTVTGNTYLATTSGSVGIGTTSPAVPLEVIGQTTVDGAATGAATGTFLIKGAKSDSQGFKFTYNNSTNLADITNFFSGAMTFGTNNLERMRIDSTGNIGIGVTPSAWGSGKALEVGAIGTGLWSVSATDVYFSQGAYFNAGWKYAYTGAGGVSSYEQVAGVHKWFTAAGGTAGAAVSFTQAMTLDANGRLIIGTTSGPEALNVYRGAGLAGYIETAGNGNTLGTASVLYGQDSGSNGYYWNRANAPILFGTNNTEKARLTAAGELLVGKTAAGVGTDGAQLLTTGFSGVSAAGTTAFFLNRNTNDGTILEFGRNGVSAATMGLTSSALTIGTAGSERMRIDSTGNVGINTNSPTARLHVVGTTQSVTGSTGIQIYGDGGSGYVNSIGANPFIFQVNATERMRIDSTGNVSVGTAALATTATNGFLYIPTCAGIPTGVPTAKTGLVPMVYDSTNNKFYIYNGAWKSVALL